MSSRSNEAPKHTPGPWRHHKMVRSGHLIYELREEITVGFAHLRADAQLIAAAPDMLEVLKKTKTVLESGQVWDRTSGIMMIDEVVAKAEGRTQSNG